MKIMKNGTMGAIDIALIRLDHVPFVVTNNRKMAVWTDVKEIMLWCPSPQCSVVLDALKVILGYPAYERAMHPCSQLEQLMFLKHFMFVTHGTLLVDIESLRDGAKLALLYNMVREKHTRPDCQTVFNCTNMLKTFSDKYSNTSFKIPLSSASAKNLLPAVKRISKNVSSVQISTNNQACGMGFSGSHELPTTMDNDGGDLAEQNRQASFPQTAHEGNISRTLVPLALVCKLYPGCEGFLDEVVRLYVLGQCEDKNLQSVCQCTVEEGIQLTRFLATQNGYEKFWLCLTTCSLMMSWLEFWHGYDRMCRGGIDVLAGNVCVVSLNCQTTEMRQNDKVKDNKKKTTAPCRQTLPTQPSPSLSTINDITANVQSQNRNGPLAILSAKSQSLLLEDTAYCKCDQNFEADNKTMTFEKDVPTDETEGTIESSNCENDIVTDNSNECKDKDDAKVLGNEKQSQLKGHEIKDLGKRGKKKLNGSDEKTTSRRQRHKEADGPKTDDKAVSELSISEKTKPYKTRRKSKQAKAGKDAAELRTVSKGIKSRLRSRNQEGRIIATDEKSIISKDANNSAMLNVMSSSLQRSGSGDSNNSESKSVEMAESGHPSAQQAVEVSKPGSLPSQYTQAKMELPMSEVSPYDLTSMKYPQMPGIHVSITPKNAQGYIHTDNIPGEISPDLPLFEKRNIEKTKVDSLQSIRNGRELLKISSAQIQDEIPVSFKYIPNSPTVKASSSPTAEQACSVTRNKGKKDTKSGPVSQDVDKFVKANKLEYISLTPKQLELTGPMAWCPVAGKVQRSKTIPYKPLKAEEETARKNRTEAVINRPRTNPVPAVLQGKTYQHNTTINSCKLGQSSADEKRGGFDSTKVEPCLYSVSQSKKGMLHEEMALNLQKQAVSSFCSVSGNQDEELAAEGKAVKHFDRTKDLNSSEFLKERITMWKNEVEQSITHSPGRLSKSADLVRRRNMCTYRPRSSIYSSRSQSDPRGPSIKTALCSLFSRDRASPDMLEEQIHFQTSADETNEMRDSEKLGCEYSNNYMSSSTPIASKGRQNFGQIKLDYQYDVQNYGSSSSVTPDIYDEFARKRKPKSLRPEIVKIKPKPVATPFPTTPSQPVVRKQQQSNLQMSRKPNYHTVGYMSGAEISNREKEVSSSYINQDIKQMYSYTNTVPSQNLPHYSQTKVSIAPQQMDSISNNPHTFCLGKDSKTTDSDENQDLVENENLFEHQCFQTASGIHVAQSIPHEVSSSSVKSDGKDKSVVQINRDVSREDAFPPLSQTIKLDKNTHDDCLQGYNKKEKYKEKLATEDALIATTCSTADRKNNISSAMNKLSSFLDCIVTPSKVESLEYINSLQALTGASTRKCQSEVNTTNTEIRNYETRSGSQQGVINSQRSKSELRQEENKLFDPRPREHVLSKVDTQLYYTVPGDDMFHPVSENMMIPRYAQFFVQTDETESVKGKQLYPDQDTRLEHDLSESGDKETGKEAGTNEGTGRLHADSNSNEEKLSSTTFDSIIKATDDFIDRSRLIKHVISKTKQAIERTEADEDDATLDNQTEVQEINGNVAEQIEERNEGEYPKVIMPSAGQTVENQSTSRKKSFKEIIEEKREEKRKIQLNLSRKKYWNSAHAKKDGNTHLSIENKFYKQRNGDQSDNGRPKGDPKQKNESVKHEEKIDNQKIKQQGNQRQINSKFVVTSQRRPKTCIGFGKGRTTKDVSSAGRKRIKDIPNLGARSHTSFAAKQKHDRASTVNRSKYQQPAKGATIFPRSKNSKSKLPKESDDCTSKILTALRRLSIEKSPKTAEQKGSSKQEVRQNKLRDCVAKQIPLERVVKASHTDTAIDPESDKTVLIKDSNDLYEVHGYQNKDEVEHVCTEQKTQFSKIPVLIGLRKDIHDDVPEEHEYCVERNENVERFAVDLQDFTVQRQSHNVTEQVDREFSEYEINMQQDKSESDVNQEAAINKETFITLYDTRELALYRPGSASQKSTSDSSVDVSQMNEEKYLGIPYFHDANSNMNNVEYKVPVVNLETTNCFRSDSNLLEKETGLMTQLTNEELYNMNFFPNKIVDVNNDDPFEQIATVSTTSIRNGEYQNQQDLNFVVDHNWKVESNTEGMQHVGADLKACADNIFQCDQTLFQDIPYVKQDILDSENAEQLNDKCLDPNWLHITFSQNIEGNPQDGYYLAQADAKHENNDTYNSEGIGKHQDHEHFTFVAYDVLKAVNEHSGRGINIIESNIENGSSQYTCETEPYHHDQLVGADENLTNIYFCKPVIPGSMMQQAGVEVVDNTVSDSHLKENTEGVDIHLEDPVYEDWDHCYQVENSADKCQEQGQSDENLYIGANCLNDCDNGDFFLDETDCGEEVYIGDNETDGRDTPDLENGIFNISESELVNNIVTPRKSCSEISVNDNSKDNQEKDIDNLEIISCLLKENSGTEKKPEEQKEGKKINSPFNKDVNTIAQGGRKKSVCRDKKTKIKQKPKKEKTKFVVRNQLGKSEHIKTVEKYSPSQSEVEAYFEEISKRTGIDDIPISKNKKEDNTKITMNYNSDTDSESGDSLPEFSQDFSITGVCLNKSECNEPTENDSVKTDDNQDRYNEHLRLYNDDEANDGDIDDDDDDDDDGDDDGGGGSDNDDDDDYNPEADFKELEEYSDYSVSDDDTCENGNSDSIDNTRRNNLKKAQTCTKINKRQIDFALKKKCRVSLEKVRQSFQKKYDIKNSSSIRGWKKKSPKTDKEHGQKMGSKMSTSNRQPKERENSVVREFCLKNLSKNNDTPDKKESDNDIYLENFMKSHSHKKQIGTESTDITCLISSSNSNIKLKETIDSNGSKNIGMDEENEDKYKITETDYKYVQKTKKKKRGKKTTNDDAHDEIDKSEDEMRKQKDENMAAEGFIKTQKRYYEILRNSAVGVDREDIEPSDEQSVEETAVDKLSEVIEAVPVHGERVITKALSDAEKALEGTGSLEDIHSEDEGAVIEDLINQCSYQMIEDEDHVQLGGVAHFKDFALPFVYINGYKYTPLRDTLTIFLPECCVSACTIPRSVLQKHKSLVKSFSTWEQVYKLELIKMKKGPAVMTGDMLIKLDTFLTLLPELIQQIVELHIGTKLKRSKKCDINAYKILKSKFM